MSYVQIIIDEQDIRLDAVKAMIKHIIQRPVVLVVIVSMSPGKRYDMSSGYM